jgi:hypothetical protein
MTAGVIAGAVISMIVAQTVATMLFGLQPRDPVTLAGAVMVLASIGALAGCPHGVPHGSIPHASCARGSG